MSKLSDLIEERLQEEDVSIRRIRPSNPLWERCKKEVSSLPMDYVSVFKQRLISSPLSIKKHRHAGGFQIIVDLPSEHYEKQLVITESEKKGITKAYYVCFNGDTSTAYIRDLL